MPYIPAHESQTDQRVPAPYTNCTFASGAMLVDWWTYGRINTDDVVLRNASGVPISQGANFPALRRAIAAALGLDMLYSESFGGGPAQIGWRNLRDHLANDGAAVVAGQYKALAPHKNGAGQLLTRWQLGGDFAHALVVVDYRPADETVLFLDPLGHSGYAGDRADLVALWDFIFKNGNDENAVVSAAHAFAGVRPPPVNKNDMFDLAGRQVRTLVQHFTADVAAIRATLLKGRQLP